MLFPRLASIGRRLDRVRIPIWRHWDFVAAIVIAVLLIVPRLSGPIDLRYDAGVYYLLGTSLAKGEGYRIPSEPGSPTALQYPPGLPVFVAIHQAVLGSTDPAIVAPWLRRSFLGLFLLYAVVVHALAKRFLPAISALAATALALLHVMTFFLSDLLFAELPFAVASVGFALVAGTRLAEGRPWSLEFGAYTFAVIAFMLRTAGLALFIAWVLEALIQRRWRLAGMRTALALAPLLLWQGHVRQVQASNEYRQPAYEYQRAPYQYYNVSYAENLALRDPFRPELGLVTGATLVRSFATNLCLIPSAVGEAVSTNRGYWLEALSRSNEIIARKLQKNSPPVLSEKSFLLPVYALAILTCAGLIALGYRRAWMVPFIVIISIGLVCTTPWPGQFSRYLSPLTPFLTISALLGWSGLDARLRSPDRVRPLALSARLGLAAVLVLTFALQLRTAAGVFRQRQNDPPAFPSALEGRDGRHFFYHDAPWRDWEEAVAWLGANSSPDAIVSTTSPHFLYLRTGRRAILPPMESNAATARRLLEAVPVSHVIVDELGFLDVSRRYALPAVQDDPNNWRIIHSVNGVRIYERAAISR